MKTSVVGKKIAVQDKSTCGGKSSCKGTAKNAKANGKMKMSKEGSVNEEASESTATETQEAMAADKAMTDRIGTHMKRRGGAKKSPMEMTAMVKRLKASKA